jgi:[acyl-carrier-protein] S-malonyltransferase
MIRGLPESPHDHDGGPLTASVSAPAAAAEVVAVVAGRAITRSALYARVDAVRRGPRGRHLPPNTGDNATSDTRWIVQELVTEAVLEHEIAAAGLGSTSLDSVVALVDRVTAGVSVPEVEVRSYYERNDDLFRRPDAHGLVPYADARADIEAELLAAARVRAFGEWLDRRRRDLADIDPAYAHPGDPVHGLPSHRH